MTRTNKLTRQQRLVIDDLFDSDLDESAVLQKHNVARRTFDKWQSEPPFIEQFNLRLGSSYRRSAALLARQAVEAARRLIALAACDKEETARKACLDIIMIDKQKIATAASPSTGSAQPTEHPPISPETAARLLAVLAEEADTTEAAAKASR